MKVRTKFENISEMKLSDAVRFLSVDMIEGANSGHPGLPLGMADVATVLFRDFLKFDIKNPKWPNRDRFILSAGHGSAMLYSLFYLLGYEWATIDELKKFRQIDSLASGHPENNVPGIEVSTGPLGQGIAMASGIALSERMISKKYPSIDHKTYVIASDGDMMEGITQEAISFAGHQKLSKLIVLYDNNGITIDGKIDIAYSDDILKRFEACNWEVFEINGHDENEIHNALSLAQRSTKPVLISCKTIIGMGAPNKSGSSSCHGSPLGKNEVIEMRKKFGWDYIPFSVPDELLSQWREIGIKKHYDAKKWYDSFLKNINEADEGMERNEILRAEDITDDKISDFIHEARVFFQKEKPIQSTRQLSQTVLNYLKLPYLIGGSADLTPSNNTKADFQSDISDKNPSGNYIHYGIRESAMAAIMNGMASYGENKFKIIPYGGTFLVFSDYMRPAIRLSAMMRSHVVYVFTHDSIAVGEDGPTHQPVEQLACLRAIPHLRVLRPCCAHEVADCWEIALKDNKMPSAIILTRQNVDFMESYFNDSNIDLSDNLPKNPSNDISSDLSGKLYENLSKNGGYIIYGPKHDVDVTIAASGSEVGLAISVAKNLNELGIEVRVLSIPCLEVFKSRSNCNDLLYAKKLLVAIESGIQMPWDFCKNIAPKFLFFGVNDFGMSGKAQDVMQKFGLDKDNIIRNILYCF